MNEETNSPNEKVEKLLRRWGAAESVSMVRIGAAPQPTKQKQIVRRSVLVRWLPTAAAAALLIAATVVFFASSTGSKKKSVSQPGADASKAAEMQKTLDDLRARMRQTLTTLQRTQAQFTRVQSNLAAEKIKHEAARSELAKLQSRLEEINQPAAEAQLATLRAELNGRINAKQAELERIAAGLKTRDEELTTERKNLANAAEELAGVKNRMVAAIEEVKNLRKMNDEAIAARQKALIELMTLKARSELMLADFQRLYLSVATGGEIGLAARQNAAKHANLLRRCAQIRPSARSAVTGQLLDKLEVVLTRLELLNAYNSQSAGSFTRLVRDSKLLEQIDDVLATGGEEVLVRTWLIEVKLILAGADRVVG